MQIASLTVNGSNFKPTCKLPVGIGLTDSAGNITTSTITNHVSECDESGLEYQGDRIRSFLDDFGDDDFEGLGLDDFGLGHGNNLS